MTNAELAERLYWVLDACLDDDVKNTGYGDNGEYCGMHPSGIIRVWNRRGFTITEDLSSISFVENEE